MEFLEEHAMHLSPLFMDGQVIQTERPSLKEAYQEHLQPNFCFEQSGAMHRITNLRRLSSKVIFPPD